MKHLSTVIRTSNQMMDQTIVFKMEPSCIEEKARPDEAPSPAPSLLSVKSEQSMDIPIAFNSGAQSYMGENTLSPALLTEDHYKCSVCTEVFKDPVSIPCGHSYCKHCIEIYWSKPTQAGGYACPQCRKRFRDRPVLSVNVALSKLIEELQKAGFSPALPAHCYAGPEDVPCDICTEKKLKAVKSCLTCTVSYCETHIRQHYTVPALQRHNLVEAFHLSHKEERESQDEKLTARVIKPEMTSKEGYAQTKRLCRRSEVHCSVPLKVWLYLKKLDKSSVCAALSGVSENLMQQAENILEHLRKQIRICQDMITAGLIAPWRHAGFPAYRRVYEKKKKKKSGSCSRERRFAFTKPHQ